MAAIKYKTKAEYDEEENDIALAKKNGTYQQPSAATTVVDPVKTDNTAMLRRYETLRNRAKADVGAQVGEQQDALQRRFAQLGNLSSGAAMKQQSLTAERGAQLQQRATEGLDAAQTQEQEQMDAETRNKQFSREERVGAQQFASGERAAAQQFALGEREAGQKFAAGQSSEARAQADRQYNASMELQKSQFGQQFGETVRMNNLEAQIQKFNMDAYEAEMNRQSMFDRVGGMGTTFWKGISGDNGFGAMKNAAFTGASYMAGGPIWGAASGSSNLFV